MKKVLEFPDHARVQSEAAAWVAKLDAGNLTARDLAALRAWAARGSQHRKALDAAASSWDDLNLLALYRQAMAVLPDREADSTRRRHRWQGVFAMAAGLVAAVFGAWLMVSFEKTTLPPEFAANGSYATVVGEQRVISLPDGSAVRLNTNSRLQVSYSSERRALRLQQGEAFFEVARNKQKPFVVHTTNGEVTAVGTAFAVHLESAAEVRVTVSEGRVRIAAGANENAAAGQTKEKTAEPQAAVAPARSSTDEVSAGQVAVFSTARVESIKTLDLPEVESKLAWRTGMLQFSGEPLESVIAEIGRYTSVQVVIADSSLRALKVGGYFRVGDTEILFDTLESDFGIVVDRVQDGLIQLRKRPS